MAAAQTTTEQIAARRLDTVDPKVDLSLMVENRRGKTLLEARQRCPEISHLRILFGAPDGRAVPITNHESRITDHYPLLRLDLVGPEKLPGGYGIDCDRYHEQ